MSTRISPENEDYIQRAIRRGEFHSRGEALNAAVELLRQRQQLIREVNAGVEQLERGEGEPLDINDLKTRGRKRLAQKGSRQP